MLSALSLSSQVNFEVAVLQRKTTNSASLSILSASREFQTISVERQWSIQEARETLHSVFHY